MSHSKAETRPVKIGEGSFGQVVDEGKEVRKIYDKHKHMIQEVIMLKYMTMSDYIVKLNKFNMGIPSICVEKWSCSLRDCMKERDIAYNHKMKIFKCVLMGLCHMHQAGILQSDLKLSNILIDVGTYDACICDLGLSSLVSYAKIFQTAKGYCPPKLYNTTGHDMFGLCVSMLELFGDRKMIKLHTASELRKMIKEATNIRDVIKKALVKMCPDDPRDSASADRILYDVFGIQTKLDKPEVIIHENITSDEKAKYLHDIIEAVTNKYEVNRGLRCYECMLDFFNSAIGRELNPKHWKIYIAAGIYIFSCLFGTSKFCSPKNSEFDGELALDLCRDEYSIEDLNDALTVLISYDNFINMIMYVSD